MTGISFLLNRSCRLASCQKELITRNHNTRSLIRKGNLELEKELPTLTKEQYTDYLKKRIDFWKKADNLMLKAHRQGKIQGERLKNTFSLSFILSHLRGK